jgi:hypothetical protein
MSGLNSQIRDRIESFAGELAELIRKTALESVTEALGGAAGLAPSARQRGSKGLGEAAPRERGGKRTPEEIVETTRLVEEFVGRSPGQGVEQIAKALGLPTKELTLPIKKLIAARAVMTEGQKRATKYYPASAEAAPAPARSQGGRKARGGSKRTAKTRGKKRG